MFSKCLFYFDVINSFLNEDLWESIEILLVPGKTFWKTTHPPPPPYPFINFNLLINDIFTSDQIFELSLSLNNILPSCFMLGLKSRLHTVSLCPLKCRSKDGSSWDRNQIHNWKYFYSGFFMNVQQNHGSAEPIIHLLNTLSQSSPFSFVFEIRNTTQDFSFQSTWSYGLFCWVLM